MMLISHCSPFTLCVLPAFVTFERSMQKKPSLLQIEAMIAGNANAHHPFSICATNRFAADAMRGTKYKNPNESVKAK